ncbi:MAG TPA: ABC transporter ATP-binding protein [Dongiaceae bacterium]|jgi:multiple sugar transport system ATP-binding protein|nr:ABC transporter ATP-binding protein [Dongiaceae bacterium]
MATLSIRNVKKRYGALEILKGIDIELADGEFLVLLGPSGCGKSTLLNIIAGLLDLSEGEIRIGDRDVSNVHPKDRDIAMVFQSYALYPNMNVARNLAFGLEMRGVEKAKREKAIAHVAQMLQIEHLLSRKPAQLSGGQRQRVAIGRALVREPKVFLFDEPLSNLDAKLRVEMRTEIKKLHHRLGTTIVYVTHDQIEAMTLASRIAIMQNGEVQQFASPQEVYEQPVNMYVAGFMGSPAMNFLRGTLTQQNGRLSVALNGGRAQHLPLWQPSGAVSQRVGQDIILGLRPENFAVAGRAQSAAPMALAEVTAQVDVVEPTGADTLAFMELGGANTIARLRPGDVKGPGEELRFAIDMSRACLFDPTTERRL